jgi:hypothetical protein
LISSPAIFEHALLELGLARLPAPPPSLSSCDFGCVGAIARQQFDVLDRQEQLGLAGIVHFEAVMRRAAASMRLQADEAADAVLDMDDDVTGSSRATSAMKSADACGASSGAPAVAEKCPASSPDAGLDRQTARRRLARLRHRVRGPCLRLASAGIVVIEDQLRWRSPSRLARQMVGDHRRVGQIVEHVSSLS